MDIYHIQKDSFLCQTKNKATWIIGIMVAVT